MGDSTREEKDYHHGGGYPEGAVEVGIAVQCIEKGRGVWEEGKEGVAAAS